MKKVFLVGTVMCFVVASYLQVAYSQLQGFEGAAFANYLADQTPKIYDVKQNPKEPKDGERVEVIAKIANDEEKTDDVTVAAFLVYSTDNGKTWNKVDMVQDEKNDTLWRGLIPGQPAGTKVIYYLQAVDSAGNKVSEMPGINTVWPPNEKENLFPLLCEAGTDKDDDVKQVKDDLDILQIAIGYDEKYIYGKVVVQGKIDGGVISPPQVNAYAIGCFNIDKGEDLLKGAALAHIPLADAFPKETLDNFGIEKMPAMIDARAVQTKKAIPYKETEADAYAVGNSLYFRFLRSVLGHNPSGQMKFLSITGYASTTDIGTLMSGTGLNPGDASTYLYVYLRNNSYEVR